MAVRRTTADPVKARTRSMHATLKRRAGKESVMSLEDFRAEFDFFMQDGRCCPYCWVWVSHVNVSLDHKIPVNRGGLHTMSNLAFVCKGCNSAKGDLTADEFAALLKVLDALEAQTRNFTLKAKILTAMRVASSFRIGANRRAKG